MRGGGLNGGSATSGRGASEGGGAREVMLDDYAGTSNYFDARL